MTITITASRPATDMRLTGLGFRQSDLLIDGFQIGIVLWPRDDYDLGMLQPAPDHRLRFPPVRPDRSGWPYVRFGGSPHKCVIGGLSEIVQAVKDELARNSRADEIARTLWRLPWEYIEGFLSALEGPYVQTDCSASCVRLAIRELNRATAPRA